MDDGTLKYKNNPKVLRCECFQQTFLLSTGRSQHWTPHESSQRYWLTGRKTPTYHHRGTLQLYNRTLQRTTTKECYSRPSQRNATTDLHKGTQERTITKECYNRPSQRNIWQEACMWCEICPMSLHVLLICSHQHACGIMMETCPSGKYRSYVASKVVICLPL